MIPPADLDVARIWGRDHRRSTATWADAAAQRQLDRGLLPRERAALLTLNRRDFADFTEHDGLVPGRLVPRLVMLHQMSQDALTPAA